MADKSDVIQDYLNSLNEAMAIHAKKAVEGLEFDRTELAEIVDITNRDKGEYQVFNGSQRYYAYSENTSYTLGTKVYITIPNNDYTQQKLIKGKYKRGDGDTGIAWISPLKSYSPSTDNLIEDKDIKSKSSEPFSDSSTGLEGIPVNTNYDNAKGYSLLANYNKVNGTASTETLPDGGRQYIVLYKSDWIQEDSQYNKNFKYMGLSAKFKTALSAFYPVSGSYGLLILINYSHKLSGEEPRVNKLKVCKLDTTSMIGSVYNFNTFYKQEALYQLDNDPDKGMLINQVAVIFYQDGEFRDNNNQLISPYYKGKPLPDDNIFVKDIGIWFGDDKLEDDKDEATIYTLNGESYDSAQTNDKLNEKRIHLKWLHVNPIPEEQEDGTRTWTKELMDKSDVNNVPSAADVKLIANIHWYTDAQYTIETYRATQAATAEDNDRLWEVTEKWKYAPTTLTEEEIQILVQETNWSPKKDYTYLWDEELQRYVLTVTASGEQVLNRKITRNAKVDKVPSVNDELAGSGWIPIDGTWNAFEIVYQPDNDRQYSSVKCIIEIGPELMAEDENTGEKTKTGLVDPNSTYYTKLETNILTFKNLSWVPDIATHDTATGITLTIDDKTDGHYPIYNATNGRILSLREIERLRTLKADMISRYTGNSLLNGNEIILWQIPKTNTMININGTLTKNKDELITEENKEELKGLNIDDIMNVMVSSIEEIKEYLTEQEYNYFSDHYEQIIAQQQKNIQSLQHELTTEYDIYLQNWETLAEQYKDDEEAFEEAAQELNEIYLSKAEIINNTILDITDNYNRDIDALNDELRDLIVEKIQNEEEQEEFETTFEDNSGIILNSALESYDISEWFDVDNFDFDNYYYIVRFGSDVMPVNSYQGYYINEYYVKSATNNTIFCYIVKNNQIFKGSITLTFAQHGSSGTDYTFSLGLGELIEMPEGVLMGGDNNAIDTTDANWDDYIIGPAAPALTLDEPGFRRIKFELYDSTNTLINLTNVEKNAIISKWIGTRTSSGYYSGYNSATNTHDGNANNLQFLVKQEQEDEQWYCTDVAVRTQPGLPITSFRYIIFSAAVKQGATSTYNDNEYDVGPVNFVQMLPLHIRKEDSYSINGADFITYDDSGANPQCFNDEYKLDNFEGEKFRVVVDDNDVAVLENNTPRYKTTYKWYPHLDEDDKLVPCQIYVDDLSRHIAVEAFENVNGTPTLYTMPILMIQNRYQIPAINSWNGELLIDEEGNRMMAATIAAGHKDNENRFTGVIMGDVERKDPTTNRDKLTSGLFGYNTGAESFGFLSDGTGFIGKAGTGRIEFDGSKGVIQSANYNNTVAGNDTKEGTKIDLDDGSIDMWGQGNSWTYDETQNKWIISNSDNNLSTNIHLDTVGSGNKPYFKIAVPKYNTTYSKDNNNNIITSSTQQSLMQSLIQIDKSNFYLQTADYDTNVNTGLKIDLKNGRFDSRGRLTINGALGSSINFGDNNSQISLGINQSGKGYLTSKGTLQITGDSGSSINFGDNFRVNANGNLTAKNAYFEGDITGSKITGSYIYGNTVEAGEFKGNISASNGNIIGGYIYGGMVEADQLSVGGTKMGVTQVTYVTDIDLDYESGSIKVIDDISALGSTSIWVTGHSHYVFKKLSLTIKKQTAYMIGSVAANNSVIDTESLAHNYGTHQWSVSLDVPTKTAFNGHTHSFSDNVMSIDGATSTIPNTTGGPETH